MRRFNKSWPHLNWNFTNRAIAKAAPSSRTSCISFALAPATGSSRSAARARERAARGRIGGPAPHVFGDMNSFDQARAIDVLAYLCVLSIYHAVSPEGRGRNNKRLDF